MRRTAILIVVGLAALAACTTEQATTSSSSGSSPIVVGPTESGTGPGTLRGHIVGDGFHPGYTVEVPTGWFTEDGGFMIKDGVPTLGLGVWDVGLVPKDPCHWEDTMRDSGETVDDLLAVLLTQKDRHATDPVPVTVDGHDGVYLEWTVPEDQVQKPNGDFVGCDYSSGGHYDFFSWWGNDSGGRYHQAPGQLDRLWVLDVDGQTLVIDATSVPDSSAADIEELEQVVASIRFAEG